MSSATKAVLTAALELPKRDRARVATALLESLDARINAGTDQAWLHEVERRVRQIESNEVKLVDWDVVRRRARGKLRRR